MFSSSSSSALSEESAPLNLSILTSHPWSILSPSAEEPCGSSASPRSFYLFPSKSCDVVDSNRDSGAKNSKFYEKGQKSFSKVTSKSAKVLRFYEGTTSSKRNRSTASKAKTARRASTISNLLKESSNNNIEYSRVTETTSLDTGIDTLAFERYYEDIDEQQKIITSIMPSTSSTISATSSRHRSRTSSTAAIIPSTESPYETSSSPRVILHSKIETLLKLLAQSVHIVFASLCSRKARRKDRECTGINESKLYLEEAVLERNIPETDLKTLVDLPAGLGYEEWLASHTIEFFHHINLLYGTVCEFCTLTGCPDMSAPGPRHYLWFDEKGKKTRVPAPQYVDYVMTFTQNTVNDETIFPTKFENDFPSSFESIVKKIHRLLFHVVAHLYHAHFREVYLLSLHSHLNCLFAHFVLFNDKFRLIDEKETEILHDLVVALKIHPESTSTSNTNLVISSDSPSQPSASLLEQNNSSYPNCSNNSFSSTSSLPINEGASSTSVPMASSSNVTATVTQVMSTTSTREPPLKLPFLDDRRMVVSEALP